MSIKRKTSIFTIGSIVLFLLSWLVYDIYAINKGGTEASISFMMYEWSYKYPIFTWVMGFLPGLFVGHFWWRIRDTETTKELSDNSRK
jgi:hypothetical protein